MAGKDKLSLRIGDQTVINYTAKDKKTRVVIDMSGSSARAIQTIFEDYDNPTTTVVSTKDVDENVDAGQGEIIEGGGGGKWRFIYTVADVLALNDRELQFYYFATKLFDVNGDPSTVEDGVLTFRKLLVANPP